MDNWKRLPSPAGGYLHLLVVTFTCWWLASPDAVTSTMVLKHQYGCYACLRFPVGVQMLSQGLLLKLVLMLSQGLLFRLS